MESKPPKKRKYLLLQEYEGEYPGNIWGWKFSFLSLALILFVLAVIAYGHYSGKVDIRTGKSILKHPSEQTIDSLK